MSRNKDSDKGPRSAAVMCVEIITVVGGSVAAVALALSSHIPNTPGTPYPTAEQLGRTSGKRVVVMVEDAGPEHARDYCWALGLQSETDPTAIGGIGCKAEVATDLNDDTLSLSEQIDACQGMGGTLDLVFNGKGNPTLPSNTEWACLVDPSVGSQAFPN